MTVQPDIRKIENVHVALWLVKDISWCSDWQWLGMLMVVPTLIVATRICWLTRTDAEELVHNLAVVLWISANITWMIGEFFYNDGTRPLAQVFFAAGAVCLAGYYGRKLFQRTAAFRA